MHSCIHCRDTGLVHDARWVEGHRVQTESLCKCDAGVKRKILRISRYLMDQDARLQMEIPMEYPPAGHRYGLCMGDETYRTLRRHVVNRWEPES